LRESFHIFDVVTVYPEYRGLAEVTVHQDFKLLGADAPTCQASAVAVMTVGWGTRFGIAVVTAQMRWCPMNGHG
jgi:hypothetical protein